MISCPDCGEPLRRTSGTTALHCTACGAAWVADLKGGLRKY